MTRSARVSAMRAWKMHGEFEEEREGDEQLRGDSDGTDLSGAGDDNNVCSSPGGDVGGNRVVMWLDAPRPSCRGASSAKAVAPASAPSYSWRVRPTKTLSVHCVQTA